MLESLFFTKERFQHRCFPSNFVKFLRAPILYNICKRLLLKRAEFPLVFSIFFQSLCLIDWYNSISPDEEPFCYFLIMSLSYYGSILQFYTIMQKVKIKMFSFFWGSLGHCHCVNSVQVRSFFWSVFGHISHSVCCSVFQAVSNFPNIFCSSLLPTLQFLCRTF